MRFCIEYSKYLGFLYILLELLSGCSEAETRKLQARSEGQVLYAARCAQCHGKQAEGLGALYPDLRHSAQLRTAPEQAACQILYGYPLGGQKQTMPSQPDWTPRDVAAVLTYLSSLEGNTDSLYVSEQVAEVLKDCKR